MELFEISVFDDLFVKKNMIRRFPQEKDAETANALAILATGQQRAGGPRAARGSYAARLRPTSSKCSDAADPGQRRLLLRPIEVLLKPRKKERHFNFGLKCQKMHSSLISVHSVQYTIYFSAMTIHLSDKTTLLENAEFFQLKFNICKISVRLRSLRERSMSS